MAIETIKTLDQLKQECKNLGIEVKIDKREKKEYYIRALRNFYLRRYYGSLESIPSDLQFILSIDSPMLCKRYQQCKKEMQDKLWVDNNEYVIEEKLDGVRMLLYYDHETNSFSFYSRNNSSEDFLPQNYKDKILTFEKNFKYDKDFVLDCELLSTKPKVSDVVDNVCRQYEKQEQSVRAILSLNPEESKRKQESNPLKFFVFDCLYDGKSLLDELWDSRHLHTEHLTEVLKDSGFLCELNQSFYDCKRNFYDSIIEKKGEGVIFKNRYSTYNTTASRTNNQIKLKRNTKFRLENDIDAWISGFTCSEREKESENLIEAVEFSIKLRKENGELVNHVIGYVSDLTYELKKELTINVNGRPMLNPKYLGKVAVISGQNVKLEGLILQHAIILEWRPDKSISACEVLEEIELRNSIL